LLHIVTYLLISYTAILVYRVFDFRLYSATLTNVAIQLHSLNWWQHSHDVTSPTSIQRAPCETVHSILKTLSLFRNALY